MKKLYLTLAIICYIMTVACVVVLVIGTCMRVRTPTIISIGLSMIASALNGIVSTIAYWRELL